MSVLAATTLRDRASAKDVPVETVRRGAVKMWARVNQVTATQSVQDSLNLSSLTDGGVGLTTFNFTLPMANANFAGLSGRQNVTSNTGSNTTLNGFTAGTLQVASYEGGSLTDAGVHQAILGDHT